MEEGTPDRVVPAATMARVRVARDHMMAGRPLDPQFVLGLLNEVLGGEDVDSVKPT